MCGEVRMLVKKILKLTLALSIVIYCTAGLAAGFESATRINSAAKNFILSHVQTEPGESIEVLVNQSNTPIKVSACSKEIEADFPENANKEQLTAVSLSCNDAERWHVLVPVEVQIFSKVIVAKHTIPPRQPLTENDIDYSVYNKNRLYSGYFVSKEEVVGTETARLIPAGTILTRKNIQLPLLVHRNQLITLIAQSKTIMVSMQGIAKSDGALNSVIKVFNPSSKRTLDAVVVGPNKAQISA